MMAGPPPGEDLFASAVALCLTPVDGSPILAKRLLQVPPSTSSSSTLLLSRLDLSDTKVYEPLIRETASHFCAVVAPLSPSILARKVGEPKIELLCLTPVDGSPILAKRLLQVSTVT